MIKRVVKNIEYNVYMILLYLISLIIFEFIFGVLHLGADTQPYYIRSRGEMIGLVFIPYIYAGIIHFIFVSVIAIFFAFSKKIKKENKYVTYFFPFLTFYLSIPIGVLTVYIAELFNIPIILGFDVITSCV